MQSRLPWPTTTVMRTLRSIARNNGTGSDPSEQANGPGVRSRHTRDGHRPLDAPKRSALDPHSDEDPQSAVMTPSAGAFAHHKVEIESGRDNEDWYVSCTPLDLC